MCHNGQDAYRNQFPAFCVISPDIQLQNDQQFVESINIKKERENGDNIAPVLTDSSNYGLQKEKKKTDY